MLKLTEQDFFFYSGGADSAGRVIGDRSTRVQWRVYWVPLCKCVRCLQLKHMSRKSAQEILKYLLLPTATGLQQTY